MSRLSPKRKSQTSVFWLFSYAQIAERVEKECGVAKTDVMISIVENGDADWSFGMGQAQFIKGLL
ncbi:tautomerase family protein [Bacillus pumilus]|nr:tautomerase family protein [Bacillus pumilus]